MNFVGFVKREVTLSSHYDTVQILDGWMGQHRSAHDTRHTTEEEQREEK
jgi:hypothetical protein